MHFTRILLAATAAFMSASSALAAKPYAGVKTAAKPKYVSAELTIAGDNDYAEVVVYKKKGVSLIFSVQGSNVTVPFKSDRSPTCTITPCGFFYAQVEDPTVWYGGCENRFNDNEPDLTSTDGVCSFIENNRRSGSEDVAWYYGASLANDEGRQISSEATGGMIACSVLEDEEYTCRLTARFADDEPKKALSH